MVCAIALLATVSPRESYSEPDRSILFVTAPEAVDQDKTGLADIVLEHVSRGLRHAIASGQSKYTDFVPEGQAQGDQKAIFSKLRDFARYSNLDLAPEARQIQERFGQRRPGAFVYVRIMRAAKTAIISLG